MKYDKGSFITVPNKASVMGVSAPAQALFMWLCDYANTDGSCFPSRSTLAGRLNCSVRSVDAYIDELESMGLISKENRFKNNEKVSNNYYIPLWGGSAKSALPSAKSALPLAQNLPIELNPVLTQPTHTSESKIRIEIVSDKEPKEREPKADTKYRRVFEAWGEGYPLHWRKNTTEIEAAKNILVELTLEDVAWAIKTYERYKSDPYCPKILKPSDLDRKWDNLVAYDKKKKHG